jgi:anionic cell wall polymer biosynthesis LytR-Cps2A-Psr (LCP) family protein
VFTKIKSDKRLLLLFFASVFAIGFALTYFSLMIFGKLNKNGANSNPNNSYSLATPEPIDESKKGIFNVLLLGYGGGTHSGSGLTDSIIVIHIDTNTKKYLMVSIPRDFWIQGGRKINAEASVNGYQGLSSAVGSITGLSIDNYVAINFANFTKMIDNLGGVNVEVPATFTDNLYPIEGEENNTCGKTEDEINALKAQYSDFNLEKQFTCRYETISYQKGPATLNGVAALKFVRSRHGDSDFGRSARQFAVLKGILTKLVSLKSVNKLETTIGTIFDMVKTDLTLGKIKTLLEAFGDTSTYEGTEIHLTTENYLVEGKSSAGAYVLYPKAGNSNYSEIKSAISSAISH